MKKYNLKRFLASLLAVLMLASVTGVSPAVFADDNGSTPPSQEETVSVVAPVLKEKTDAAVEVLIKDGTNVKDALAKALLANYDELTAEQIAAIDWQYECEGYRWGDVGHQFGKVAWGSIDGFKSNKDKYTHDSLAAQKNDKTFKVCIGSDTANYREITKVDKYSTTLVLKENASITYNMDAAKEKEAIVANVIDYEKSVLPAGTTAADFTVERKGGLGWGLIWDKIPDARLDAGENQTIRIKYNGNETYKASNQQEATINVAKATVKVSVTPITTIYAGEEIDRSTFYTLNPNDPALDVYIFFVGVNSNLETCVNIKLSEKQEKLIDAISDAQQKWYDFIGDNESLTLKEKLREGITVGELKDIINGIVTNDFMMGILKGLGYDTEAIKNIVTALDTLTSISDDTVVAIGTPAHAGAYVATAVAVGKNYETGTGTGSLIVLKNWKNIKLEKNPVLNSGDKANTITVSQAEALKDGNDLCILTKDGEALNSASAGSIHYWFTGVGKFYAKSTMPTAPGKYIVTASVRGGDFFAFPKTFVFTIVADPTPEVTPET